MGSLLSGKKLKMAHVILARGDEMWTAMFDAEGFVFRGLKLPKAEYTDAISAFQQRMISLGMFLEALLSFYDKFLESRCEPAAWKAVQKDIHKWVAGRAAKR